MLCKKRSSAHARSKRPDLARPTCAEDRDGHSGDAFKSESQVSATALYAATRSEEVPARHPQRLISAKAVRELLGSISDQTLWRWCHNAELGFPRAVHIARRRYWKEQDVIAWIDAQSIKHEPRNK